MIFMAKKRENEYQAVLIKKIKKRWPDAFVMKNDPNYIQGVPDLCVLKGSHWAMLETKRDEDEPHRPNQDHYVEKLNGMGYSSFIFPQNEKEVLDAMERIFEI